MPSDPCNREEHRYQVLKYLYERAGLALARGQIGSGLARDGLDLGDAEVDVALQFLVSAKLVQEHTAKLGSSKRFQITAEGSLAHERP